MFQSVKQDTEFSDLNDAVVRPGEGGGAALRRRVPLLAVWMGGRRCGWVEAR